MAKLTLSCPGKCQDLIQRYTKLIRKSASIRSVIYESFHQHDAEDDEAHKLRLREAKYVTHGMAFIMIKWTQSFTSDKTLSFSSKFCRLCSNTAIFKIGKFSFFIHLFHLLVLFKFMSSSVLIKSTSEGEQGAQRRGKLETNCDVSALQSQSSGNWYFPRVELHNVSKTPKESMRNSLLVKIGMKFVWCYLLFLRYWLRPWQNSSWPGVFWTQIWPSCSYCKFCLEQQSPIRFTSV